MRILTLQRRLHETGNIRLGQQVVKDGKSRPVKLDRFRFTSRDRQAIEQVAKQYGGQVAQWEPSGGAKQWEVISEVKEIPVVIPTSMAFSQAFEQWRKGFCTNRCDGVRDSVRDVPCDCDPEAPSCQITTRLSVILPEIPGLGTWRLQSTGYYAAVELAAAVDLIESAVAAGMTVPARLILDQNEVRRLVNGKAVVYKFPLPVLDLDRSFTSLGMGSAPLAPRTAPEAPELAQETGWQPIQHEELPPAPAVTVAAQLAEVERPKERRKNAAPLIAPTGVKPRPAAAVDPGLCDLCGLDYGSDPLTKNPVAGGSRFVHVKCKDDAETPADEGLDAQPASVEESGSRGGTPGGGGSAPARPAPAAAPVQSSLRMSHNQHKKVMALTARAYPALKGETSSETDARRRQAVLGLCATLGQPGIESRTEITNRTAVDLIDTLQAMAEEQEEVSGT